MVPRRPFANSYVLFVNTDILKVGFEADDSGCRAVE